MNLEVALVVTVGGIAGSILVTQMLQMNWFRRERFKFKQSQDKKENSIRFRKLERDLKIKEVPPEPPQEKGLFDLAKGLDVDTLKLIAGAFQKKEEDEYEDAEYEEKKPDIGETLLSIAQDNPELVQQLIGTVTKKKEGVDGFKGQDTA